MRSRLIRSPTPAAAQLLRWVRGHQRRAWRTEGRATSLLLSLPRLDVCRSRLCRGLWRGEEESLRNTPYHSSFWPGGEESDMPIVHAQAIFLLP